MGYDSAFKKKEILPYGTTWTDLVDIMLNKLVTEEKILHDSIYKKGLRVKSKGGTVVARGWGRGK